MKLHIIRHAQAVERSTGLRQARALKLKPAKGRLRDLHKIEAVEVVQSP